MVERRVLGTDVDTRTKIVAPDTLASSGAQIHAAKGWFDVLTSEHCELLEQARPANRKLLVLVYRETEDRPAPLPAYDRAQMVAALTCVDLVCITDAFEADAIIASVGAEPALDMDASQSRDVVRHVIATQRG
ncbi:MAG: hypothetical protein OXN96_04300 [Bryobacterales bacterium]|nr:hypothetical protein [Bryobacterales bacterium]